MPNFLNRKTCTLLTLAIIALIVWLIAAHILVRNIASHSPWDQHSRQSLAWLDKKNYIEAAPLFLEVVSIDSNKAYVSFPPTPSLIELPFVAIFGLNTPNTLVMLFCLWLSVYALLVSAVKNGSSVLTSLFLVFGYFWGTQIFYLSLDARVWNQGHIWGVIFSIASLFCAGSGRAVSSGFFLGLSVGCRPFNLGVGIYSFFLLRKRTVTRRINFSFFLGLAIPLVSMAVYNFVRFGNPVEFGHKFLPWSRGLQHGVFSSHYLFRNLWHGFVQWPSSIASFDGRGTGLVWMAPILLLGIWSLSHLKNIDRVERMIVAASAAIILVPQFFHESNGWFQFGYRFSVDIVPVLVFFSTRHLKRLDFKDTLIIAYSMAVNVYGAFLFYRPL